MLDLRAGVAVTRVRARYKRPRAGTRCTIHDLSPTSSLTMGRRSRTSPLAGIALFFAILLAILCFFPAVAVADDEASTNEFGTVIGIGT